MNLMCAQRVLILKPVQQFSIQSRASTGTGTGIFRGGSALSVPISIKELMTLLRLHLRSFTSSHNPHSVKSYTYDTVPIIKMLIPPLNKRTSQADVVQLSNPAQTHKSQKYTDKEPGFIITGMPNQTCSCSSSARASSHDSNLILSYPDICTV